MAKIKTLEDLRFWCFENNIPLEKARFALGEDKVEKRWFGIYQKADGEWIVYKNKDDGTRFIRYQGFDEAEACNILLSKIKEEVRNRKTGKTSKNNKKNKKEVLNTLALSSIVIFAIILISMVLLFSFTSYKKKHQNGYYSYDNRTYYRQNNKWYYYDTDYLDWYPYSINDADKTFRKSYGDYYLGEKYYDYTSKDFKDTDYYEEYSYSNDYDDDDDYDYSWDSGSSWDSYDTDWGSDW